MDYDELFMGRIPFDVVYRWKQHAKQNGQLDLFYEFLGDLVDTFKVQDISRFEILESELKRAEEERDEPGVKQIKNSLLAEAYSYREEDPDLSEVLEEIRKQLNNHSLEHFYTDFLNAFFSEPDSRNSDYSPELPELPESPELPKYPELSEPPKLPELPKIPEIKKLGSSFVSGSMISNNPPVAAVRGSKYTDLEGQEEYQDEKDMTGGGLTELIKKSILDLLAEKGGMSLKELRDRLNEAPDMHEIAYGEFMDALSDLEDEEKLSIDGENVRLNE
ncbi:hypothetical protein ACSAZK_01495 [Methanosarcina sp. Mfa9]|uniref:hypothetical protein n=1 Tax=Methanosarcina sp. Mfa9 TaxID=3439063 RepID=UPI003F82A714